MTILIAKANAELVQSMLPAKKIQFNEYTKNTLIFKISKPSFDKLYNQIKAYGYNPFALLTW